MWLTCHGEEVKKETVQGNGRQEEVGRTRLDAEFLALKGRGGVFKAERGQNIN